jgi:hypothetical protein
MKKESFIIGRNAGYSQKAAYYTSKEFESVIINVAQNNVDWVALNVHIVQERWFSQNITFDFCRTAKDHELEYAVKLCRKMGLKVMLKPLVLCLDGSWRGMINFLTSDTPSPQLIQSIVTVDYWRDWFSSYRCAVTRYATIAQRLGVDCFCIGSELLGTQKLKVKEWQKTIDHARNYFKGDITYELAIADSKEHTEIHGCKYLPEYSQNDAWEWYNHLDFLSASKQIHYFDLANIKHELEPLALISHKMGKPILLSNCKIDHSVLTHDQVETILQRLKMNNYISGCFV